jgi:shikimate kinase
VVRLSLIGMAGSGKSYWSMKLAEYGYRRICCDDLIAARLASELKGPDGSTADMGAWMGLPYEWQYKERESKYLTYETQVMMDILEDLEGQETKVGEPIVVDTTGSVIYTGDAILTRLKGHTTVVYLPIPTEVQETMLKAYLSNPGPMLWRNAFNKRPQETNREALARCYPQLLMARQRLYEPYADVTIDYYRRREEGFGVEDFLNLIRMREQPQR